MKFNSFGGLGDGSTVNRLFPVKVNETYYFSKNITNIVTGIYHTCIITEDFLSYCFGKNK
jgi:alpha-tubulin suppressor-like RCC1 family protein